MSKVQVIIKEETILELTENANKGDIIDLKDVMEVDTTFINQLIEKGKDKVYQSKLESFEKELTAIHQADLKVLTAEIDKIKLQNESNLKLQEQNINQQYQEQINNLKQEKLRLENQNKISLIEVQSKNDQKYQELELKYQALIEEQSKLINQVKLELQNEHNAKINEINRKHNDEINQLKADNQKVINEKDEKINTLTREKSHLNVKQIGEDLEIWCDNLVQDYMQNGFFNCTWEKDNKVIKNEDEAKGSKADYIFKIYASNNHLPEELLTSICLEMKDENPNSINKQTNESYYKKLDANRNKKGCQYALLVSNLENDKPNSSQIFKVNDYPDMYVVRPAYLMTFLNMITSLTTKYSNYLLESKEIELKLKSKTELIEIFNDIKLKYLDKPLASLETEINTIMKLSDDIITTSNKIQEHCDKVTRTYINKIIGKLDKFELELNKSIIKKLDEEV